MQNQRTSVPAYYSGAIHEFAAADVDAIVGCMASESPFKITPSTVQSWRSAVEILQAAVKQSGVSGWIALEYDVPRLGSRIDAVIVADAVIIPIEFKVGSTSHDSSAFNQAWDYGLDLKNFHAASHERVILPIAVATLAKKFDADWAPRHPDGVHPPLRTNQQNLATALTRAVAYGVGNAIDGHAWGLAAYSPSPTIVQAAQALYARHTVEEISRSDSGARNLSITSRKVDALITRARTRKEKILVLLTGVPGAGKTLVGLNIATNHRREDDRETQAIYLSGNQPLVTVLQEALVLDEVRRQRDQGLNPRKGDIRQLVKPFIQIIHRFRDEGLNSNGAPESHTFIFDEAQRVWNREKLSDFMARKKGRKGFKHSEAEVLIEYADRHEDWAVVVCLVGEGQEIHDGEAGISSWLEAAVETFHDWQVLASPELEEPKHGSKHLLDLLSGQGRLEWDPDLHLATSMRSFRAENLSRFVSEVLNLETAAARDTLQALRDKYPLAVTRDLDVAKKWIRDRKRGTERAGLVASSQGMRLKPLAIHVKEKIDPVHWFLGDPADYRSSDFLEDAATEFQVQGLEVDWVCVSWDGDLRLSTSGWLHHDFHGGNWRKIHQAQRQKHLVNSYRVLLTRARQGMIILVPRGSPEDRTRLPSYYDSVFAYLAAIGADVV